MPMIAVDSCVRIWSCWLPGKHVDDAVDRALGTVGVQRAEHDVARFGRGDGRFDRLQVAHFADQDHVRVLPQARGEWPRQKLGTSTPISRWLIVDFLW